MPSLQPHLVALAGRVVIAFAAGAGSKYRALIILSCILAQDRPRVQHNLAMALYYVKLDHLITTALALVALAVVYLVFKLESTRKQRQAESKAGSEPHPESGPWTGPGKPLLFPCVTSHARFVPKRHAFVYSYLVVGVPVGWTGVCGGMISVAGCGPAEERINMKRGWYHIDAEDYLERGNGHLGLRGKLDAHLVSNDVDPKQYPHAYFVTAAKFLGYHFNPISFWYLYNADKQLTAVVLEVNNTFGERRMYYLLLKSEEANHTSHQQVTPLRFKQAWPKDFHVSPFNSRKGSYELFANDPIAPNMQGTGPISVKVVLRTSENESKIVARLDTKIFGKRAETDAAAAAAVFALDPAAMTLWQKAGFLAAWWWVGFATFPRIVKHASILFFWKRLHVWFRPEPLLKSMGRLSDSAEKTLEESFRLYLQHLVDNVEDRKDGNGSDRPLAIMYHPCGNSDIQPCLFTSPSADKDAILELISAKTPYEKADIIQIHVLTPVFYTRFVHYAHDVEAFFCEHLESCTVDIKPPGAAAILSKRVLTKPAVPPPVDTGLIDYFSFNIIRNLRRRPEPIKRPMIWPAGKNGTAAPDAPNGPKPTETAPMKVSGDLRYFRLSAMDGFFLSLGREYKHAHNSYRSTLLSLFLADRFLSGSLELLSVVKLGFYVSIAWICTPILLWVLSTAGLY